jgi:hypothetical protein
MDTLRNSIFKLLLLSGAFSVALGLQYAVAWAPPSGNPPNSNTSAPLNVSSTDQVKNGGLSVNALSVFGNQYVQGNLGIGEVSTFGTLDVGKVDSVNEGAEIRLRSASGSYKDWIIDLYQGEMRFMTANHNAYTGITTVASWDSATNRPQFFNGVRFGDGTVQTTAASASPFAEYYESPLVAGTDTAIKTFAHGLSGTPRLVQPVLLISVAWGGYNAGDEVWLETGDSSGGNGYSIAANATDITVRGQVPQSGQQYIRRMDTGALAYIPAANFSWRIRAWR